MCLHFRSLWANVTEIFLPLNSQPSMAAWASSASSWSLYLEVENGFYFFRVQNLIRMSHTFYDLMSHRIARYDSTLSANEWCFFCDDISILWNSWVFGFWLGVFYKCSGFFGTKWWNCNTYSYKKYAVRPKDFLHMTSLATSTHWAWVSSYWNLRMWVALKRSCVKNHRAAYGKSCSTRITLFH